MEDEESNSTSIKSLVAEIGKPRSNKQRQLLSELEEDGNATDDEDEDEDEEERIKSSREIEESSKQEIIKELKNIQRQNRLTHYLLTASILVTLAWQLSEFSLILRIKQGFNNPLKSIGGAIKGLFNIKNTTKDQQQQQIQVIPPTHLPGLKIPDWPDFDTSNDDDQDNDQD